MSDLDTAIGRVVTRDDGLDPARAQAMHATLDLEGPPPGPGASLPRFWHWAYFWDAQPPARLGRDGHPRPGGAEDSPGGFIPDTGLPRRMWAGGAVTWHAPLILGAAATRSSRIASIERKTGRSGPLVFVTLLHEITGPSGLALRERQDLVYRPDPSPDPSPDPAPSPDPGTGPSPDPSPDAAAPPPRQAPKDETAMERYAPDPVQLFRYSALTFNGHRIHYDLAYCRAVEGYPGLVVHGPMLAQRLIDLAARLRPDLAHFAFRAVAPVFCPERFEACARAEGDGLALWIRGADGRLAMTASARPEPDPQHAQTPESQAR
ncbi:MAG: MaoC family dehydratase N-terminal domain-containing protein [Pseudomonadota bacterium]